MPSVPTQKPPARGRRAKRSTGDERERAILATLERLLEERPLHEISVDDLARGAGISRPTFYFYFPSKEAVLLTLLDRVVEEARFRQGDAIERIAEDPAGGLRQGIQAVYDTFSGHRAATVAAAEAASKSPEVRALWSSVMESFVNETAAAIEEVRARGIVPDGIPARDLAIALNWMNERVLQACFSGQAPVIDEERVVDVLVAAWLGAIYGPGAPPAAP